MIFPPSHLSMHSQERLRERFQIKTADFLKILNTGLGKKVGHSIESHLIHRLIWSDVDQRFIVAIQDIINGTVLTVLTVEMYQRDYEDALTDERLQKVINQMVYAEMAPPRLWKHEGLRLHVLIRARLRVLDKSIGLGRWNGEVTSLDLTKLGASDEFWRWVADKITARSFDLSDLDEVSAHFHGGAVQVVPYLVEQ